MKSMDEHDVGLSLLRENRRSGDGPGNTAVNAPKPKRSKEFMVRLLVCVFGA
jgi:hypothetical protein